MSVVGATLGLLLGLGLSRLLAGLFRTFGLDIAGEVLTLTPFTIAAGYVVGILVTMVAAFVPARRAAKVPPVAAMRDDLVVQEKGMGRRLLLGSIAMVVGIALAAAGLTGAPGTDAIWIGAGAVIWVITTAVLAPVLGKPVLLACRAVFGRVFGTAGRLAGENALRNPRRTGATASALMIGLAVVSAVGVLASSLSATNDKVVDDAVHERLPRPDADVPGLPGAVRRPDGGGRRRRPRLAPAGHARSASRSTASPTRPSRPASTRPSSRSTTSPWSRAPTRSRATRRCSARAVRTTCRPVPATPSTSSSPAARRSRSRWWASSRTAPTTGGITVPLTVLEDAGIKRSDSSLSITVADGADRAAVKQDLEDVVEELPILSVQDKVGVQGAHQRPGQPAALRHLRPARARGRSSRSSASSTPSASASWSGPARSGCCARSGSRGASCGR